MMKNFFARYYVIFILIILFFSPGILAIYFFQHPELLGKSFTNKGHLLRPPVALSSLEKNSKWHLIFWAEQSCDDLCMQQLEKLAKIRLALGRKLYQVDLDLVLAKNSSPLSERLLATIKELGFHITQTDTFLGNIAPVLIANTDAYLVLSFMEDANPADIYHDLKQLLSNPNAASRKNPVENN